MGRQTDKRYEDHGITNYNKRKQSSSIYKHEEVNSICKE